MAALTYEKFQKYIARPPKGSVEITISPSVAEKILANHRFKHQRPLKAKWHDYAEAMAEGDWSLTGDTIKISPKGELIDGQNRLRACIEAGRSFPTHIVFSINGRAFANMDWSNVRGKEDVFFIGGVGDGKPSHASAISKGVLWTCRYQHGDARDRSTIRPAKLYDIHQAKFTDMDKLAPVALKASRLRDFPVGQLLAVFYLASKKNPAQAKQFIAAWLGEDVKKKGKVKALTDHLLRLRSSGVRVADTSHMAWCIELWNAFQTNGKQSFKFIHGVDAAYPQMK